MGIFIFLAFLAAIIITPVISMHLFLKRRNKEMNEPCAKYKRIKSRRKLRKDIYESLVTKNYSVNHLHWYSFNLPKNKTYTMGIVEVLDAFGDDIFKKAEMERNNREEIKNKEIQYSYIKGLQ